MTTDVGEPVGTFRNPPKRGLTGRRIRSSGEVLAPGALRCQADIVEAGPGVFYNQNRLG
jgi:hypothetical protein